MSDELLPCPCCGSAAQTDFIPDDTNIIECFAINCGMRTGEHDTPDSAIAAWNRRAQLSAQSVSAVQPVARNDDERAEDEYVIQRLGDLLAGVCIALKGEEEPMHRHGFEDIVQVAQTLKLELDLHRMQEAERKAHPADADAVDAKRWRAVRKDPMILIEFDSPVGMDFYETPEGRDAAADAAIAAGKHKVE